MVEEKKAKKIYTLEEIKFTEANKTTAIVACVPVIGLILLYLRAVLTKERDRKSHPN